MFSHASPPGPPESWGSSPLDPWGKTRGPLGPPWGPLGLGPGSRVPVPGPGPRARSRARGLGPGSWVLGSGSWVLGPGSGVVGVGRGPRVLGGSWVPPMNWLWRSVTTPTAVVTSCQSQKASSGFD